MCHTYLYVGPCVFVRICWQAIMRQVLIMRKRARDVPAKCVFFGGTKKFECHVIFSK